jgi:hypothetical protein
MAKAKPPRSVDPWPAEGLPIDIACKRIAPSAWDDFVSAWRAAARDLDGLHKITLHSGSLPPDMKRRLAHYKEAQTALVLELDGFELWARPGSGIAEFERIPSSAVSGLELDPESRTAHGKNIPPLYDVHLRCVPRADVLALQISGEPLPAAKWLEAAVARLRAAPDCPKHLTKAAQRLEKEMAEAFKRRECDAAWAWGTIKNNLLDWGWWPRTRPPKF